MEVEEQKDVEEVEAITPLRLHSGSVAHFLHRGPLPRPKLIVPECVCALRHVSAFVHSDVFSATKCFRLIRSWRQQRFDARRWFIRSRTTDKVFQNKVLMLSNSNWMAFSGLSLPTSCLSGREKLARVSQTDSSLTVRLWEQEQQQKAKRKRLVSNL